MFNHLKQLVKESLVYGISGIIGRFIGTFLVPIYTRIFNPSDYGVLDLVGLCSSIIGIFVVLGLDVSQGYYFYRTDDIKDKKLTLSTSAASHIGMAVILAIPLLLFSRDISKIALGASDYAKYFRLVALDLPFFAILAFTQRVLRLIRSPWKYMFLATSSLLSNIVLTILMVVVWRKGIYGIYLSKLIVDILFSFVALYLIKSWISKYFSLFRLKQLLAYGVPIVPAGIAQWALGSANQYFLRYYSSLSDVGLYAVGGKIASIMGLVTGAFQLAWGPFAFSIHRENDSRAVYANVLTYYLALTSGIGIGLSLFAPEILRIFTTKAYYGASVVVPYLAYVMIANGVYFIVSMGVNLKKKTSHVSWTTAVAAGVNIILNFLLIPRFGMVGAAGIALVSQCISASLLYLVSQYYYPIPYRLMDVAIILVSSGIIITVGSYIELSLSWLAILAKTSLIIIYVAILIITRILRPGKLLNV
jgi:O-antigen/teichoic acid export membrane protein